MHISFSLILTLRFTFNIFPGKEEWIYFDISMFENNYIMVPHQDRTIMGVFNRCLAVEVIDFQ
jgi:hypothetical protein